jgi:type III secretory pathway component EscS
MNIIQILQSSRHRPAAWSEVPHDVRSFSRDILSFIVQHLTLCFLVALAFYALAALISRVLLFSAFPPLESQLNYFYPLFCIKNVYSIRLECLCSLIISFERQILQIILRFSDAALCSKSKIVSKHWAACEGIHTVIVRFSYII